jgi:aspartyl-tRNA(Asn)/glutamyl-tRNA(Gln) amidotransferase subunit A
MLEAIAGPDSADATTIRAKGSSYANTVDASVAGIKVGVPRNFFFENVSADVVREAETAIETLASLGLVVKQISLPTAHLAQTVGDVISFPEASLYHRRWLRDRWDEYSPAARANLVVGETLLATDYLQAQRVRTVIVSETLEALDGVEMIATPTTPIPAIRPDETTVSFSPGAQETVLDAYCRLTYLANVTGLPALTVPCGFSAEGLPLGLQLIGRPLGEARLLQVGTAFQRATDWHLRHPTGFETAEGGSISPDARITANGD